MMLLTSGFLALIPTTVTADSGRTSHSYVEQFGAGFDETVIATASDSLNVPRDLEFHPSATRQNELWVINRASDSMTIIQNAGLGSQSSFNRADSNRNHFMEEPSAFAFGQYHSEFDYIFASAQETRNTFNGQASPNNFMGPALWPSSLSHFAMENQGAGGGLGSHLDMLHESPNGMGIAHDSGNAFWYNDGYYGELVWYDFVNDHDTGGEDHADGKVHRYSDITLTRSANIPGHMILDKANGILYIADTGAGRVVWVNTDDPTTTNTNIYNDPSRMETLAEYREITNVEWGVLASGLSAPSGIALYGDTLFVSQNYNGKISAYDLASNGKSATHLQTVDTDANSIMGLEVGPNGKLWYVDAGLNRIIRIDPFPDADLDGIRDSLDNCPNISNPGQDNHDGDSMGNVCDPDDDNDGVTSAGTGDECPFGEIDWTSNSATDHDSDGCKDDRPEDLDDDNDGLTDGVDDCPRGALGWTSDTSLDYDSDGCRDSDEDLDDDDDSICDGATAAPGCVVGWSQFDRCPTSPLSFTSTLASDADRDGCQDVGEDTDDDDDGFEDVLDGCPGMVGTATEGAKVGCPDGDGDGWADLEDTYPSDITQWRDSDEDGYGDNLGGTDGDACPLREGTSTIDRLGCPDADEDGYSNPTGAWTLADGADAFPGDESQWRDLDSDGFGDNAEYATGPSTTAPATSPDICPQVFGTSTEDRLGCPDVDEDGYSNPTVDWTVTDGADAFEYEPTQWADADEDGYGDEAAPAASPDDCRDIWGNSTLDRLGCLDRDGDGWSDAGDAYPDDKLLWSDADGDGYADQTGTNRSDDCAEMSGTSTEDLSGCVDTDGDGWSDEGDYYPLDAEQHVKSSLTSILMVVGLLVALLATGGVAAVMLRRKSDGGTDLALGQLAVAPPPSAFEEPSMGGYGAPPPPGDMSFGAPPPPMTPTAFAEPAPPPPAVAEIAPPEPIAVEQGPQLPPSGLPEGWTMEQWEFYGEQWLKDNGY